MNEPERRPSDIESATVFRPTISVIIPVYNGATFIGEALESVFGQTLCPTEIIVVDDGSTDATAAQVLQIAQARGFKIKLLRTRNQGNGAAKNAGLRLAQGSFVAFLDADDRWLPNKLEAQLAHLQADPNLAYVLCRMRAVLEPGTRWPRHLNEAHYRQDPTLYAPSALLARRTAFDRLGEFNPDYRYGNDGDWFIRARDAGLAMVVVDQVLVEKRIHGDNVSHQTETMTRELFQGLRASLKRRRGVGPIAESQPAIPASGPVPSAPILPDRHAPICVIIPVFNGERYIGAAIESIWEQTLLPQRIIIIDDGSTDNTRAQVQALQTPQAPVRIDYEYQPNQGAGAALNRGIAQADTSFLAFLDADDLWLPEKTRLQMSCFEQDPGLEAVFGHIRQFYSADVYGSTTTEGTAAGTQASPSVRYSQEILPGYGVSTLLIRGAAFQRLGMLDAARKTAFFDWLARARRLDLRHHLLDDVVSLRRVHDQNMTHYARAEVQSDYFRILKENLAQKRRMKNRDASQSE